MAQKVNKLESLATSLFKLLIPKVIEFCPILYPSEEEFKEFSSYMEKIQSQYSTTTGMVKIVPPSSWKPRGSSYDSNLKNLIIKNPIRQEASGKGKVGVYEFTLLSEPQVTYEQYIKNQQNGHIKEKWDQSQIQSYFWKNIAYSSPLYGADLSETLMDEVAGSWNLNRLDSLLRRAIQADIRGVTTSYCYIGSWKSLFCWHKEDLDLAAINYLHFGSAKYWYCIQPEDGVLLEKQAKKEFQFGFKKCSEYLRHKLCLINPYNLKKTFPKLKISRAIQKERQFIVAFSGAYHCGFNSGINVAEAVNFATLNWLKKLPYVRSCVCRKNSVRANFLALLNHISVYPEIASDCRFITCKSLLEQKYDEDGFEKPQPTKKTKKIEKTNKKPAKKGKNKKQNEALKEQRTINEEMINTPQEIDTEIQCDKCGEWRLLPNHLIGTMQEFEFFCDKIGLRCREQEIPIQF